MTIQHFSNWKRLILPIVVMTMSLTMMATEYADFYRVEASKGIKLLEWDNWEKVHHTIKKGQIIEVYAHLDTIVNGLPVYKGHIYVPYEERGTYMRQGYDITDNGYLKNRQTGRVIGGPFLFNEEALTEIDPPDSDAQERYDLARWDQKWSPFYEPILVALALLCIVLFVWSVFHLKFFRIILIFVISVAGALNFYGTHGDSYSSLILFPAAIFMPLAYCNLLLPWNNCARKELAFYIICGIACLFTFFFSVAYLKIVWGGWFLVTIAAFIATFIVLIMVMFAGQLRMGSVCPECGYYGRQKSTKRSELVDQSFSTSVETTEYRRTDNNRLVRTDTDTTEHEHVTRRFLRRCKHCGYEYEYERSVTFSGPTHRETEYNRW